MNFCRNILTNSHKLIIKNGYMYNLTSDSTGYEVLNTVNNPYFQPWGNIFGTGGSPTFNGTSIGATLKLPYNNKIPLTMQLSGVNTNSWKVYFSEDGVSFEEIYSGGSGTVYIPFNPDRKVKYIKFTASGTSQMKENKVLVRQWAEKNRGGVVCTTNYLKTLLLKAFRRAANLGRGGI